MTRLQQLRLDAGLTLAQLEEMTGVSKQTLSNLENGRGAHPATLKALGDYFEVRPSSLLFEARDPERDVA
jgi:transcriptional regulator with XRE-family HTH domain